MKRIIEITIDAAGESHIEVSGFRGPGCLQATAFLEEALGTVQRRQRKPEYLQKARRSNPQRLGR